MKNTKPFKVVMLPTEKASRIAIFNNDYLQDDNNDFKNYTKEGVNKQHLYIISDDEIKEGDWVIHYINQQPKLVENKTQAVVFTGGLTKKIVATTDNSLKKYSIRDEKGDIIQQLPQLPESFIQAYIKAYDEGKPIIEVDLEMDELPSFGTIPTSYITKTRPDNTVIVHQSKIYSKKEAEQLIRSFSTARNQPSYLGLDKWIQDNL